MAVLLFTGIFLFTKSNPIRGGIIIPDREITQLTDGKNITNPHYSGVTKSGDAFSISATSASSDDPKSRRIDLVSPHTTVDFANGPEIQVTADSGALNMIRQEGSLKGSVYFQTSNNYFAKAESVKVNFFTGNVESPDLIEAYGPIGRITAKHMELIQDLHKKTSDKNTILRFSGNVKLIYYPNHSQ